MFNKFKKKEKKELKKSLSNTRANNILNVIDNFNTVIDVENGWFVTKDKKITFVFQLESIDFDILDEEAKENVLFSFKHLLNEWEKRSGFSTSINFNQYIFKVPYKMDDYEKNLENQVLNANTSSTKRILEEEYQEIQYINQGRLNVLATYLTYSLDLSTLRGLYSRVDYDIVQQHYVDHIRDLNASGIAIKPFDSTNEFLKLFMCNLYNNNIHEFKYLSLVDNKVDLEKLDNQKNNVDVVYEQLSMSKKLYSFIPKRVKYNRENFITNSNTYNGIVYITGYPEELYEKWGNYIYAIVYNNNPYIEDLSIKLTVNKENSLEYSSSIRDLFVKSEQKLDMIGQPITSTIDRLLKRSQVQRDRDINKTFNDYDELNEYINQGGYICDTFLAIRFTTESEENYKRARQVLTSNLKSKGFDFMEFDAQQIKLFNSWVNSSTTEIQTSPHMITYETLSNELISSYLSNTITTNNDDDDKASFIGYNNNGLPITFSMFPENKSDRTNHNMSITGISGFGKSTFTKKLIKNNVSRGVKQYVLDIESEYIELANTIDNSLVLDSNKMSINPLMSFTNSEQDHLIFLREFLSIIFNLDSESRDIDLILKVFNQLRKKKSGEVIMSNLVEEMNLVISEEQFGDSPEVNKLDAIDLSKLTNLKDKLELKLSTVTFNNLFNKFGSIDINKFKANDLIVFDMKILKDLGNNEEMRAYSYLLVKSIESIIYYINDYNNQPQLLYVDEIHLYVSKNPFLLNWFNQLAGILRKRNAGIVTATQNIKDITKAMSDVNNRKIIDDATYKVFFRSDSDAINFLKEQNPLLAKNIELQNNIKNLQTHNAVIFMGSEIVPIELNYTQKDYEDFGKVGK